MFAGFVEMRLKQITLNYLTGWFVPDLANLSSDIMSLLLACTFCSGLCGHEERFHELLQGVPTPSLPQKITQFPRYSHSYSSKRDISSLQQTLRPGTGSRTLACRPPLVLQ